MGNEQDGLLIYLEARFSIGGGGDLREGGGGFGSQDLVEEGKTGSDTRRDRHSKP